MNYLIYNKNISNIIDFYNIETIENNCIKDFNKDRKSNVKIILPTNKLCLHREKEFIEKLWTKHELPYSSNLYYNFNDFLKFISKKINYKLLKKLLTEDIFISLIEEACHKTTFSYYSNQLNIPSKKIVNLLTDIIWGLIKKGIKVDDLESDLTDNENKFTNKDKLNDIISIYKEFNELTLNYYAESDLIEDLLSKINNENITFSGYDIYYFQYFKEFKRREIALLRLLFEKDLKLIIRFDFLGKNNPQQTIYNGLNDLITIKSNFELINNGDDVNSFITEKLFDYENRKEVNKIDTGSEIKLFACEDKKTEIKFITTLVKKLILVDGIEPKDIIIFARTPSDYSKQLKFQFDNAKIPFNVSDRLSVKDSPIVDLILNYIEFINSGYNNKYLFKLIKSPWFKLDDNFNKNEFILVTERYRLNYNNLNKRLEKVNNLINKVSEQKDKEQLTRYSVYLTNIFKYFNLDNIKLDFNYKSLTELVNKFIKLIDFKNIYNLEDLSEIKEEDIEFEYFYHTREKERIFSAIKSFMDILDNTLHIHHKFSNKSFKIDELLETLYFVLDRKRFQIRELYDTSVTLTSIEQGRGIDRKVTILCGAVEGQFPMFYKTEDVIGRELKHSEIKHKHNEEELFNDLLFANNKLSEKIYFTYPCYVSTSEKIKSHFITEFSRLITNYEENKKEDVKVFIQEYELVKYDNPEFNISNIDVDIQNSKNTGKLNNLSQDAKTKIDKIKDSKFSATKIDELKNFPYNFLVNRIMNLKGYDSFDEEPMVNEIGSINHAVNKEVYSSFAALMKSKIFPFYLKSINEKLEDVYPVDIEQFADYNEIVKSAIDTVFAIYPDSEFFKYQKNIVSKKTLDFLDNEKALVTQEIYYPSLFEFILDDFEFKLNNKIEDEKVNSEVISDEIQITGSIDRVDLKYVNDKLCIGIVDYKSSKKTSTIVKDNTKGEHSFQMYIYLMAIKEIIKNNFKLVIDEREIILTDENIELSYALYYNLKTFEDSKVCLSYYANNSKLLVDENNIAFQQKLLFDTYGRIINKDFEFNGNKNKYNEEINLMIR